MRLSRGVWGLLRVPGPVPPSLRRRVARETRSRPAPQSPQSRRAGLRAHREPGEEQADWLEQLRCIVCEWQREYRKVSSERQRFALG